MLQALIKTIIYDERVMFKSMSVLMFTLDD